MTIDADHAFWESRFAVPDYVFGKTASAFLQSCKSLLPSSGKALAIADGEGRNGVWIAQQGLDVLSLEFSPSAQGKAGRLADAAEVTMTFELADAHNWTFPEEKFDVVADIFTQFSTPEQRLRKFAGSRKTMKRGGLLIMQGYGIKQLQYRTGGPEEPQKIFTRELLEQAFGDLQDLTIVEREESLEEGTAHHGISAYFGLIGYKPIHSK